MSRPEPTMPAAPAMPTPVEVTGARGVTVAAYDFGGSGRDLLFTHGNGLCAAVWVPVIEQLAPLRRVALDARAHGRSGRPGGEPWPWEDHGADVLAVVDALDLRDPVGVGHSMGGAALLLAEQARPGTFSSLWLYEPIVFPPSQQGHGGALEEVARRRRDRFDSPSSAFANFATKPPLEELSDECLAAYVAHGFRRDGDGITLRCRPEDEAAGFRMGGRHGAWDHLGDLRCPVTVVRGTDAVQGPAVLAPAVVERLPRGRLEDHPELGHFGPFAAPGTIAASISASLG